MTRTPKDLINLVIEPGECDAGLYRLTSHYKAQFKLAVRDNRHIHWG